MAMKSAAPTARRELTKRKIERRKNRPINFFSVTVQLLQDGAELELVNRVYRGLDSTVCHSVWETKKTSQQLLRTGACHIPPNAAVG